MDKIQIAYIDKHGHIQTKTVGFEGSLESIILLDPSSKQLYPVEEPNLAKVPYLELEQHLKNRREETDSYLKWVIGDIK